jgi:GntR family transcriptional regulator
MAAGIEDWTQTINPRDPTPLHAQIERSIRVAIASRRLRAGDQLPTVRQLAVSLRINANTVARVYSQLERAAVLETRRGIGTFVADRAAESPINDETLRAELKAIVTRALAEASASGFSATDLRRELQAIVKGVS